MTNFKSLLFNDLKKLYDHRMILFVGILTFVFSMAMAVFPDLEQSNFIYFNIFILPVIVFSISMFIGREEETLLPLHIGKVKPMAMAFSKILSSAIVELIPIVCFTIILNFIDFETNYYLLFLAYMLGVILHIIIALSLAIISQNSSTLSLSYLVYVLVFGGSAILYSNGLIPLNAQYFMLVSPAFLSSVLIDNILVGTTYSEPWLIVASVVLQLGYGFLLTWFVIRPYFKSYILL